MEIYNKKGDPRPEAGMTNQGWNDAFGVRGYGSPIKICKHILLESPCTLLLRARSPLEMTHV